MKPKRNEPCPCGSGRKYKNCCLGKVELGASPLAPKPNELDPLIALFNSSRFAELETQAYLLTERYPRSGIPWNLLGVSLRAQGKDGLPALKKAAELMPGDAMVHNSLGNALKDRGQLDAAVASYRRSLELKRDYAEAHNNLGVALMDMKKWEEAAASYRQAIKFKPDFAGAHYNLGIYLKELGQYEAAVASYRRALELGHNYPGAYNNLGIALKELGQHEAAIASYRQALTLKPDFAEAYNNLGVALMDLGQHQNALACYSKAIELEPDFADAYNNMGVALKETGQPDLAIKSCRLALEIKPDFAAALNNLGNALQDLGQFEDAKASYSQAVKFKPDYAEAYNNLGVVLKETGQLELAEANCRRALELKPDYAEAFNNLGNALEGPEQLMDALESYRLALKYNPDLIQARSNILFILNYAADYSSSYLEEAREYGRTLAEKAEKRFTTWGSVDEPKRLKVGVVSGDLCKHPVGYFLESVLAKLDNTRIELIAYPTSPKTDELTGRIKPRFSSWKPLFGLSDEAAACLIHDDGVHVLMDLSGHTGHNRLPVFAWKPAPVQVTWLGYLNSTGLQTMDYILADPWALPPGEESQFTETPWHLPETYICFSEPEVDVEVVSLPAMKNGFVTFGCFNNLRKLNDRVIACWAQVLLAVPESKLYLKTMALGSPEVRESLANRFADYGIGAERLQMEGAFPSREEHFRAYQRVDIALDPFPYPGITTTVEGLWMGVPSIALRGDRFLSHQGETILHNVGLSGWIAENEGEYVAKAVAFSSDLEQLSLLRAKLRKQTVDSPLLDAKRFSGNLEDALWGMWQKWQDRKNA